MKGLKSTHFWVKIGQFLIIASVLPVTGAACGKGIANIRANVEAQLATKNCGGVAGAPARNGGGFVASTAFVDNASYVSPDSQVCGNAKLTQGAALTGSVKLDDFANVSGQGTILSGKIWVHGFVSIYQNPALPQDALNDNAPEISASDVEIYGTSDSFTTITDKARIIGYVQIGNESGGAFIHGNAVVENDHLDFPIVIDSGAEITGSVSSDVHGGSR